MKKHYRKETDCANCGTPLEGKFCYNCGQENLELKESFGHMMNHAISDYFHFDHQFFSTLKPLLFEPGKLTNEYMAGKRVSYLHPVKMYIFISLVYFILLFKSGYEPPINISSTKDKTSHKKEMATTDKKLDSVIKNSHTSGVTKKVLTLTKGKLDSAAVKDTSDSEDVDPTDDVDAMIGEGRMPGMTKDTTYAQYLASQAKLPAYKQDGFFDRLYHKKSIRV